MVKSYSSIIAEKRYWCS